jgi:hypothetical protein
LAFFNFWHPETAVPSLVLSLEIHVHASELDIISLVALVPRFNFLVCVVEQEVVTLLNAVLDNVKFDFGLFLVETPHVFGKCHDVSHNAALVLSLLVSMQRSLRVRCIKNKIVLSSRLIFNFFVWIFLLLLLHLIL